MTQGLHRSQEELRAVLRGLLPVAVDAEGLMAALADLANRTQGIWKINCVFDCPKSVRVTDNSVATHLYLIGHEAVHNAVKHAQAHQIRIALRADPGLMLSVQDDGIGMDARREGEPGLGLRVMRNRAAIIGATLEISRARPSGTAVTCKLSRINHDSVKEAETGPRSGRR
jgi:signal transduction histidine kinase